MTYMQLEKEVLSAAIGGPEYVRDNVERASHFCKLEPRQDSLKGFNSQ